MGDNQPQIATENAPGRTSVSVDASGKITSINIIDQPMYWYNNAWQLYPKKDQIHARENTPQNLDGVDAQRKE